MDLLEVGLLWTGFLGFVLTLVWFFYARGEEPQHPLERYVGGRPTQTGLPIIKPKD